MECEAHNMIFVSNKIDAINVILAAVGNSPINSLDEQEQSVDVYNAIRILDDVSRQVQRRGWQFNTVNERVIKPDSNTKQIRYNPSWIELFPLDGNVYVKRGDYLFNQTNDTSEFDKDITLKIIEAVDFEDLPDCFKTYIVTKAAIKFQSRYLGDDSISQMLVAENNDAYSDIVQYSIDTGVGMLDVTGIAGSLSRKG